MNPKNRKFGLYLEDMHLSMERVEEYIGELEFMQFKQKKTAYYTQFHLMNNQKCQ